MLRNAGGARATTTNAGTGSPGEIPGMYRSSVAARPWAGPAQLRRERRASRAGQPAASSGGRAGSGSTPARSTAGARTRAADGSCSASVLRHPATSPAWAARRLLRPIATPRSAGILRTALHTAATSRGHFPHLATAMSAQLSQSARWAAFPGGRRRRRHPQINITARADRPHLERDHALADAPGRSAMRLPSLLQVARSGSVA